MASTVLLTVALMPPLPTPPSGAKAKRSSKKSKPKAVAVVELSLPNEEKANEVFLRIAAEFQYIAKALSPEEVAETLTEGAVPSEA